MTTVLYTNSYEFNDSSVIRAIFYRRNSEELYVVLHSGTVAGYANVPPSVFSSFVMARSAGEYWNNEVKPHYTGISGDVVFAPADQQQEAGGKQNFSVLVTVNGDLKFDLPAENIQTAFDKVNELVGKTVVDGTYFIKGVNVNQ